MSQWTAGAVAHERPFPTIAVQKIRVVFESRPLISIVFGPSLLPVGIRSLQRGLKLDVPDERTMPSLNGHVESNAFNHVTFDLAVFCDGSNIARQRRCQFRKEVSYWYFELIFWICAAVDLQFLVDAR
ncbi:hypothetical protein [Flaviflexus salsibiostraticola]|uniref:hypothetical protein n=1 Tax=Flaviflexus salsibiostraticola TaxID=1282737 RepID=UPI0013DDAD32|nr:hypothetical protein [Flaviflexus salsibiostraticola]